MELRCARLSQMLGDLAIDVVRLTTAFTCRRVQHM